MTHVNTLTAIKLTARKVAGRTCVT